MEFNSHACCYCYAIFGMPVLVERRYGESHDTYYCPYCRGAHWFSGKTKEEKLKVDLREAKRVAASRLNRIQSEQDTIEHQKRRIAALKGHLTRRKNEATNRHGDS